MNIPIDAFKVKKLYYIENFNTFFSIFKDIILKTDDSGNDFSIFQKVLLGDVFSIKQRTDNHVDLFNMYILSLFLKLNQRPNVSNETFWFLSHSYIIFLLKNAERLGIIKNLNYQDTGEKFISERAREDFFLSKRKSHKNAKIYFIFFQFGKKNLSFDELVTYFHLENYPLNFCNHTLNFEADISLKENILRIKKNLFVRFYHNKNEESCLKKKL